MYKETTKKIILVKKTQNYLDVLHQEHDFNQKVIKMFCMKNILLAGIIFGFWRNEICMLYRIDKGLTYK